MATRKSFEKPKGAKPADNKVINEDINKIFNKLTKKYECKLQKWTNCDAGSPSVDYR